ncbi:MAG: glycosyltransferase family 4 protein [Methylovulum miyakonense]|uniref:glycosyltransferase family 4 protein n=1 Tax=Methylovulum miyakonense TaxID=645578 RepID=UPI003BB61FA9
MKQKIVIITRQLPPIICGIGEYTICLATALRAFGHEVILIAEKGDADVKVGITNNGWDSASLQKLFEKLDSITPDLVILNFTPLMYSSPINNKCADLVSFWIDCNREWNTALVVHETYFLEWWYPPSWVKGRQQRELLKSLVEGSKNIFSASQPLVDEMNKWGKGKNIIILPIGSMIPFIPADREILRQQNGISTNDIVLVLFSGAISLKWLKGHVNTVDRVLTNRNVKVHWLLLGGVPQDWFKLRSPVISPGRLPENEISAWLQAADIFLIPHFAGLCAKRSTLMAAMLHGLPIVGTRSEMTDNYWVSIKGVYLVPRWASKEFAESVFRLATNRELRVENGNFNHDYFTNHISWQKISHKLLAALESQ